MIKNILFFFLCNHINIIIIMIIIIIIIIIKHVIIIIIYNLFLCFQLSIQLQQSSEYWSDKVRELSQQQMGKSKSVASPRR